MSLTRRRDVRRGDRPPVLIDAYGADGFVLFPYYSAWRMALLERGGIVAIPHVRGGGLHGESWHRAAVGATKVRSVEDLEAAVAWFVEEGWTDAARVVVTGVSLGGVLPAAALTRRRQALGGAIVAYPVVDVHRYRRYGHRLSEDLGDPHDAPVAEGMMAYAPYPWIEDGCYPPTLILASDTDEVTPPVHAYKLTAGLQAAQECDAPVLLKMIWGSAHASFGSASFSALDAFTAQIGFMLRTVR